MRLSTLFAASFVSFAAAAALTDLPACALSCLTTTDTGSCTLADQACLCQNQDFITTSTACIRQSCSAEDDAKAAEISNELCAQAGVTQSFTTTAGASQTASAASASAVASSVTSAASASVSAIASSASSRVASVISSASAAAASATTSSTNAAPTNVVGHGAVVAGIVAVAALAL